MPAIDRSLDAIAFVSEHFRDILRRRFSELAGLSLITLALLAAIALATWSVQDPSLSHATQVPVHNLLGFPGAIFSDLAMQLLGLAAIMLLLPEMLLGWRLLAHRPVGEKWRGLLWILATFLAAAFVSTLPRVGSWPLPTGLGGVFGDALLRAPAKVLGAPLTGMALFIASALFGIATAVTVAFAAGIGWKRHAERTLARDADEDIDEDEGDRTSAWLGMIAHALLSWKARAGRLLRRTPRRPLPVTIPAATGPRQEPRFDAYGRVAMPTQAAFAGEEDEDDAQPAPRRRAAPRVPVRRSVNGYVLPSLNLLTAQRVSERTTLSKELIDANAVALES
ncbi:MAG: DNA translocase FtsK 4TM domain-containing protein, partial [Hyphomicrobiales bacterium]